MTQDTTGPTSEYAAAERVRTVPAPMPAISADLASRLGARVLDPSSAPMRADRSSRGARARMSPTVYVGDTILVRGLPSGSAAPVLKSLRNFIERRNVDPRAIAQVDLQVSATDRRVEEALANSPYRDRVDATWVTRVHLLTTSGMPSSIDGWAFLQDAIGSGVVNASSASVEHVFTSCPGEGDEGLHVEPLSPGLTPAGGQTITGGAWGGVGQPTGGGDAAGAAAPAAFADLRAATDAVVADAEVAGAEAAGAEAAGADAAADLTGVGGAWGGVGGAWGGVGGAWGGVGGAWGGVGGAWGGVGGAWGGVGGGLSQYGAPGFGGRTPVVWSAPNPRAAETPDDGPVIAVLDTGLGSHPWFNDGLGVSDGVTCDGLVIGAPKMPAEDPENRGVVTDPINGLLDRESGHGTFIAGIIRQRCRQAHILSVPVMAADGAAVEHDVIAALNLLLLCHEKAVAGETPADGHVHRRVDVVNLSMGYYHESPADAATDGQLREVLIRCAAAGIVVVAAAGNDATQAQFFPAAFSLTGVDVLGVGALNPDGKTVALFSNNGPWVRIHAPGAAVVSTVPTTLSGAVGRMIEVRRTDPAPRATIDVDDYRSGFAVWSGTSFAAPYAAADLACALHRAREQKTVADVVTSFVDASLKALQSPEES